MTIFQIFRYPRMVHAGKNRTEHAPLTKHMFVGKAVRWFLVFCATLIAWPILDAPSGSSEPVNGLVTGFSISAKGAIFNVISLPDGSVVRKPSVNILPTGTHVSCSRYTRRLSGSHTYEC